MRRVLLICGLFMFATDLVLAGPPQVRKGAPKAERGGIPRIVNPVDYGAIPDDDKPDDVAFQRAIDALGSRLPNGQRVVGMVIIPPGTFDFAAPLIVDRDYTIIRGAEQGLTTLRSAQGSNSPLLMLGIRREWPNKKKLKIGRGNWVDSFGHLDREAAPRPGMLWGVRPRDGVVTFWDGALAHVNKEGYESVRVLTVEWAIAAPNGGTLDTGACLGLAQKSFPDPWTVLSQEQDGTEVYFRTSDQPVSLEERWSFGFPRSRSGVKGVRRRAFTIDLEKGKVMAWADGIQVACSPVAAASLYGVKSTRGPFKPGLKFMRNELVPFCLGGVTMGGHYRGDMTPGEADWIFHGVRVSAGAIYADDGPGRPQRRLDKGSISDASAYFGSEPSTIGFLKQNVDPLGPHGGMLVQFADGPASGSAGVNHGVLIPANSQGGGLSNLAHPVVKNLSLESRSDFGTPLVLGPTYDLKIEHVDVRKGWHGIGDYLMGQSWTTQFDDIKCEFATDAGICLLGHILYARNVEIVYPGTTALRLFSSTCHFDNMFLGAAPPRCESLIRIHAGQSGNGIYFRNVIFDGEGEPNPSIAGFLIDNNIESGPLQIDIEKFVWGIMGPKAVMVKLTTASKGIYLKPAFCKVRDGVFQDKNVRAVFVVEGDLWHYETENLMFNGEPALLATPSSSPSRKSVPPSTTRPHLDRAEPSEKGKK